MSEYDPTAVRELLDGALPDQSPPTALDRTALVAAGRRSLRRRRLAATGGAVAGVAVLAAGVTAAAATLLPGSPAGPGIQPGGPGTSASASAPPSPSYNPNIPPAARLTTALTAQVKAYLPTANLTPGLLGVEPLGFVQRQHTWYEAQATIHPAGGGVGGLDVGVAPADSPMASTTLTCDTHLEGATCSTEQVGGSTVYVTVHDYATGAQSVRMEVLRTDRTYVFVELDNYDPTSVPQVKNPPDPTPGMTGQPLTGDQQASVVTNPALSG